MTVILKKKRFALGVFLTVTFFVLLLIIHNRALFSIEDKSIVNYTDEMFVSVSKGSVYFIPELLPKLDKYRGTPLAVTIKGDDKTALLFEKSHAGVTLSNGELKIQGELADVVTNALKDADLVFGGEDSLLLDKYGFSAREVARLWWQSFKDIEKELTKEKKFEQVKLLETTRVKALEPAFNFYGIESAAASDHTLGITGIVIFYVLYTVWWGFAIYFLCEGFGLLMTKSKKKSES